MSLQALIATCLDGEDPIALAKEQASRWHGWLVPISEALPAGADPGYDDDFQRMREEVDTLSGADTGQVLQLGEKLLTERSKDLRVATYYLWARLQVAGEAGLADGLSLIAALVERFAQQLLPQRPNSRRLALQWLASEKVLASLSRYPEVVKHEARRTVAALAWLDHSLASWPDEQRPELGPLYGALSQRLAQAGGIDAVVPQTSALRPADAAVDTPGQGPVRSGRDLLDNGRALAEYLRAQPNGWLAGHRLMKSLRWDTVHQLPLQDANGHTRLAAPRSDSRAQLKRLYQQQNWGELMERVERFYTEGVNHFWLDLQWFLCQALARQPAPQDAWADIVKRDLGMLLDRLPGLEHLTWSDGTPFADLRTREWIAQQVAGNTPQQWLPAQAAVSQAPGEVLALEEEALAQADTQGVEAAMAWLAARVEFDSGRDRWLLRLLMARVAEQCGKNELALHLLTELEAIAGRQGLAQWEPALCFEVQARLLKLLRLKAQRHDSDALTRRMESLLGALVASDPVRAALLCG